jgi:hypothetical protein
MKGGYLAIGSFAAALGAAAIISALGAAAIIYYLTSNQACSSLATSDTTEDQLADNHSVKSFFSNTLNTCVETRVEPNITGEFSYLVRDIGHGFIRSDNLFFLRIRSQSSLSFAYAKAIENIFYCDVDGIDNTVVSKVAEHNGIIYDLGYDEYLDDFSGGPPRALHEPKHPFTDAECRHYFNLKLQEIR